MAFKEDMLGTPLRPANTTAASLYSPIAPVKRWIAKTLRVCNTSGSGATFRIFYSKAGTIYDETTAQFWDHPIAADTTVDITSFMAGASTSGNVGVRTNTANALTFSLFGAEIE